MTENSNQDNSAPQHIAIILDGNRRFAKKLMLEPWKGHEYGKNKVEELLEYSKEFGITQLTLFCLSSENIKNRPKNELEFLFKVFKQAFNNLDLEKLKKESIKIKFIGNTELLPQDIQDSCNKLEQETRDNKRYKVNFCMPYGGKQELVQAIKKIIKQEIPEHKITEQTIKENLYLSDEPDLIIRTGGEIRTSNFLPFQSAYSEWIFLDKTWPEFNKDDLNQCIQEFKNRKRNFGK